MTGTATPGTDYTAPSGSLTITAGASSTTLSIQTTSDSVLDRGETLIVTLTGARTGERTAEYSTTPATTTITDTGTATVSVTPASAVEGEAVEFTVELSLAAGSDTVLGWTTDAGTATSGDDYTAVTSGALTIAAGDTTGTLTVSTAEDLLAEDDETFRVTITGTTLPSGVTLDTAAATVTGTIEDDDTLTAAVTAGASTVPEGSAASFEVALTGATSTAAVVVAYTVTGTATPGTDYTAPSGSLTIAASASSTTLSIQTTSDSVLDRGETLIVTLTGARTGERTAEYSTTPATTTITDTGTATVSVADASAVEGEAVEFTVELSLAAGSDTVLGWTTSADTATSGDDYTAVTAGTLTISAGDTTGTLTVSTAEDRLAEADETFTVTITGTTLPSGVTLGTATAPGTIEDDDTVMAAVTAGASTVSEGSAASFEVALTDATSTADVVVTYTVTGTAAPGADYTAPSGSLTIAEGELSGTITIRTTSDLVLDRGETLTVTLSDATTTGTATVDATAATTTITDPGTATVSVGAARATEGDDVEFTVELSLAAGSDTVLGWTTAADTATSGDDYTAVTAGALTISAGDTTGTLTVSTAEDVLAEADETFTVTMTGTTLPSGVTLGTATAPGTIEDDDTVMAAVTAGASTVSEGSAASFEVALTGATSTADVVVTYTVTGTATADTDYTAASGSLTITAGASSGTITIQTTSDSVLDRGETLIVTLTGASTATGTAEYTSTVATTTIADSGTAMVSVADARATEGDDVEFTVTLSMAAGSDTVLGWTTSADTATSGDDYTAVTAGTLTISAGDTTGTLTVSTAEDLLAEDDETFRVTITGTTLPSGVTLGTATGTGTIEDDDTLTAAVTADASTVPEGSVASFEVALTGATSTAAVVVTYTVTGTATSGTDYTAPSGSLTIMAGASSGTITIQTTSDLVLDRGETLIVTLTGASTTAGTAEYSPAAATTTITDPGTATVSVGAATAAEGDDVEFTVTLSMAAGSDVALDWSTTDVTATADDDYTAVTAGTLTISAGDTTGTLVVPTAEDQLAEADETFTVTMTGTTLPSGVTLDMATATGTIEDDDTLTASVTAGASMVSEGSAASFEVVLTGATSTADVVVTYTVTGTATSGTDYTAPSGSLTITAGASSGTITIQTTSDLVLDRGETLIVTLTGASTTAGTAEYSPAAATTTITDPGTATVSVGAATAAEGDDVEFVVTLSMAAGSDVALGWSTADDTATSGDDYTAVTAGTLTISAGDTTGTLVVPTTEDLLAEDDETFRVTITGTTLPPGVSLDTATATGTIEDDDTLTAEVTAGASTVPEGSVASFEVALTGATSTADVMVAYTVTGTATADTDYTAPSGSLTIAASASSTTLSIQTTSDSVLDRGETLIVTLTGARTGERTAEYSTTPATTTITDTGTATVSVTPASAVEGEAVEFTVELSLAAGSDTVLGWTTDAGTATSGDDYTAVTAGTLTIAAGDRTGTLTVSTEEDLLAEDDETFRVTITGTTLPSGVTLDTDTATGTIEDDDTLTAAVTAGAPTVPEGSAASFEVALTGATSTAAVVVAYTVTGTAALGTDYTAPSGSLTITAGATSTTFSIQTTSDRVLDPGETLIVTLDGASTAGTVTVDSTPATTTITDPGATVSVADVRATEGDDVEFTVRLSLAAGSDTVLGWTTVADTAASGDDFTAVTAGTLTIAAGATTGTLTVSTEEDLLAEDDETFRVTITGTTLPSGVTLDTATATGTIEDDDTLAAAVTAGAPMVSEGSVASFEVALTGATSTADVMVTYTVTGTAAAGTDYTAPSGSLTITAGATSTTLSIQTTSDRVVDPGETLIVTLTKVSTAGTVTVDSTPATTTITDPGATVSVADVRATEGDDVEFAVELSLAAGSDTVLGWTTAAVTATSGDDFTAVTAGALTIAAGDTTGTLTVSTEEDLLAEDDETFRVTITGTTLPSGVTLDTATATGTIEDDDTLAAAVTAGAPMVSEGSAASFEVALTGATSTADVVVMYTVTGTATSGTDYTAPSGSLTITAGATSTTFSIQTTSDRVLDPGETLIVTLDGASTAGTVTVDSTQATTTITDPGATVSVADVRATEGDDVEFTVRLSLAAGSDTVLGWTTVADTAASGDDFTAVTAGTLTIAAGATTGTLTVSTEEDLLAEDDETFRVTITGTTLPSGVTLDTATATGTIEDDDTLAAAVTAGAPMVSEGSAASFEVALTGATSTAAVVVMYTVTGTATPGTDYTAPSGSLTITAGATSTTFSIQTTSDRVLDPGETLIVTLDGASTAGTVTVDSTPGDDDDHGPRGDGFGGRREGDRGRRRRVHGEAVARGGERHGAGLDDGRRHRGLRGRLHGGDGRHADDCGGRHHRDADGVDGGGPAGGGRRDVQGDDHGDDAAFGGDPRHGHRDRDHRGRRHVGGRGDGGRADGVGGFRGELRGGADRRDEHCRCDGHLHRDRHRDGGHRLHRPERLVDHHRRRDEHDALDPDHFGPRGGPG